MKCRSGGQREQKGICLKKKSEIFFQTNECYVSHCCTQSTQQLGPFDSKPSDYYEHTTKQMRNRNEGLSTQNENGRIKAVFLRNVWELPHDGSVCLTGRHNPVICSRPRCGNNWNVGRSGGSVVRLVIQLMWWRVGERSEGVGFEGGERAY
jgi:hypothetical protein